MAEPGHTVEVVSIIEAPRSLVWQILTDFPAMRDWNPGLNFVWGQARAGASVFLNLHIFGPIHVPLPARVTVVDPETRLAWKSGLPGLITGEHFLDLEEEAPTLTRLRHGEIYSGLCATVLLRLGLEDACMKTCIETNQALQALVRGENVISAERGSGLN